MNIKEKDALYIANTYARFPVHIVAGEGSTLYDDEGKAYVDMGSGIGVTAFGVGDKIWTDAVKAQLDKLQHASNLYYTDPCVELAEKLCKKTSMEKVFFSNSGAEANECAIKTARKWGAENKGAEYFNIVTLKGSFHGRTLATLAATGQDAYHKDFLPVTPGFLYASATDADEVEKTVAENKCAAVMFEVVQGEGGVVALDGAYLAKLQEIAEKYNVLLIADEVQTGNGRSGKYFAYMHYGLNPDIVTTAKGLGGGLPIGATLFGKKTANVLTAGTHGSTFGGNPVAAAGAVSIVDRLTDAFMAEVAKKSAYVVNSLAGKKGIKEITGTGLMLGILTERPVDEVLADLRAEGVLALKAKNKVRLLPPLNISEAELGKAVEIIGKVCAK